MSISDSTQPNRRVLIASANPLFARGLQKMVAERWAERRVDVRISANMEDAIAVLEEWQPDLLIVDYDDVGQPGSIQRGEFLNRFIAGNRPMQVMLVSLRASGEVVVYDRRTLTPSQAEDWLDLPWMPAAETADSNTQDQSARLASGPNRADFETPKIQRSGSMKHYVIAGILTVIVTVLSYLLLISIGLLPEAAAVQAGPVDRMVNLQLWMIAFLFSLITVFIGYSIVVFRQRRGEVVDGTYFKGSTGLEVIWTIFPLAAVIGLSFLGAQALGEVRQVDTSAMTINVTAFQWGWIYEYPDYGVQSNILYMPINRQARLLLTSRDVIHSFWVPEFRVKQDALPGENLVKELRITPNKLGEYQVMCAELCGGAHAYMNTPVRVVTQEEFDAWLNEQSNAAALPPEERGQRAANASGCLACHSLDGAQMSGPTWLGLSGSEIQLQDGSTVTADDEYLYAAIVDPNQQIHAGFAPIMPQTYQDTLSEEQIQDIIAFINSLE